jgi:Ca2+-binding EF-hand superfamily protein
MAKTAVRDNGYFVDKGIPEGKRGFISLNGNVTMTKKGGRRNYRKEAKEIWAVLDQDKNGQLTREEIATWMLDPANGIFDQKLISREESEAKIAKIFTGIDKDNSGFLDFEEFAKFYNSIQYENVQHALASMHYVTNLPPSIVKFNKEKFTVDALEILLQDKIQSQTPADSDRQRHIVKMFKTQVQKSQNHDSMDKDSITVTCAEFRTMLMWLKVYATEKQAQQLFERYDVNGDGELTVSEFLTHARAKDYPGRAVNQGEKYHFRTGKRMYLNRTMNNLPVRPVTPLQDVFHVDEKTLAKRIRKRMANQVGKNPNYNETPLALHELLNIFKFYDQEGKNYCTKWQLKRAFDNLKISVGNSHLDLLLDKFNVRVDGEDYFDYNRFCWLVYPGVPADATKPRHLSLQVRGALPFSKIPMPESQRSSRQLSRRSTGVPSARYSGGDRSERSVQARMKHNSRLKPLRRLTPSASTQQLQPLSSNRSRTMSRSSSVPHFS